MSIAALTLLTAACDRSPPGGNTNGDPGAATETDTAPTSAAASDPLFIDVARQSGVEFVHFNGATGEHYLPEIMGPGVALFDMDGDGDLDLLVGQNRLLDADADPATALVPPPATQPDGMRLWRNELVPDGTLRFRDVTDGSGLVAPPGYMMGFAIGDIDNDGDPDVYATALGANVLYRNDGNGRFTDVTASAGDGLDDPRWSSSAAFVDYDADGDLDLFNVNYVAFTLAGHVRCAGASGRPDYCAPDSYDPVPDRLLRNDGHGRFSDVSVEAGIAAAAGSGLGVTCADFDLDGDVDLYVANDQKPNHLWINGGDGSFSEQALMRGAAYNMDGRAEASMGVSAADFDGDGDDDLFMTHLARQTNTLYENDGHGQFFDVTDQFGLGQISLGATGFGTHWFDVDNDGTLELFSANGAVLIDERQSGAFPYGEPNQLFGRLPGSTRFSDLSARAGASFALLEVSRAAAFGDIDNDGDVDIAVSNNSGPLRLLQNQAGHDNAWLTLALRGTRSPRDGSGARVATLDENGAPRLWRRAHSDGSYLAASDLAVHIGLGEHDTSTSIGVIWPSGLRERFDALTPRARHTLTEGSGAAWPVDQAQSP